MRDFEITFDDLFSNEVNQPHELEGSFKLMAKYKKELEDYPQNPCCSCNMLFCLKQGSKITFNTEQLGNVWPDLKDFILRMTLYIMLHCVHMHVLQVLLEVQ